MAFANALKELMLIAFAISWTAGPEGPGRPIILKLDEQTARGNGRCRWTYGRNWLTCKVPCLSYPKIL